MMRKLLALTSFGAGYVLGARAGRERYEQIRATVLGITHDPHVQEFADEAATFAREHGSALTDKVVDKVTGHHQDSPVNDPVDGPATGPSPDDVDRALRL